MSSTDPRRCVCVHGHFYQPPRENPWLEVVEVQDSAAPFHDWNERITAECYAPNGAARVLDGGGRIVDVRSNYREISFNFGPTLLSWLERARPNVYAQIIEADQVSVRARGHGNAMAQAYGHCILPLADERDRLTQVRWGIEDFRRRFGRDPEGMWLPETAVDRASLTALASNGIRFTVLAPSQAARVRYGDGPWHDVGQAGIDCTRPYRCRLDGGLEIAVFFYDGGLSHEVAFSGLLNDGRALGSRLAESAAAGEGNRLVSIATDGESYGHHHRFGEMALAAALDIVARDERVRLTNYAAYLEHAGVHDEVEVREGTSWSCAHGVERWRANCGCSSGAHPQWQQAWRAPLREALDWLKAEVDALFEKHAEKLVRDPWAARDEYIGVLLSRDAETRAAFVARHGSGALSHPARVLLWKLLEVQRNAMLSFTSCGWFFDEPSGLETVQILQYAARAVQLAGEFGRSLEPEFARRLRPVRSNLPEYADGADLFARRVRSQQVDRDRVMAHYAMDSLLEAVPKETRTYVYRVTSLDSAVEHSGSVRFTVGRAGLESDVTEQRGAYAYAALHLGGHDMHCSVAAKMTEKRYLELKEEMLASFRAEPVTELVRRIDRGFDGASYTLRDVFVAERRRILDIVGEKLVKDCVGAYERIVSGERRLLDFLAQVQVPLPQEVRAATAVVLRRQLDAAVRRFIDVDRGGAVDAGAAAQAVRVKAEARQWGIELPVHDVGYLLEHALVEAVVSLPCAQAARHAARAHAILDLSEALGLTLDAWEAQNQYHVLLGNPGSPSWPAEVSAELRRLGERLGFNLGTSDPWTGATQGKEARTPS